MADKSDIHFPPQRDIMYSGVKWQITSISSNYFKVTLESHKENLLI